MSDEEKKVPEMTDADMERVSGGGDPDDEWIIVNPHTPEELHGPENVDRKNSCPSTYMNHKHYPSSKVPPDKFGFMLCDLCNKWFPPTYM
ncbi:MAG: hypothetical protein IJK23_14130 [Clostridia bacterium]|nr:hypothetical protein [Clostridia bacterium]